MHRRSLRIATPFVVAVVCNADPTATDLATTLQEPSRGSTWDGYMFIPARTVQMTFDHLLIFDRDRSSPTDSETSRITRQVAWNGGLGLQ